MSEKATDDSNIEADDQLFRRIPYQPAMIIRDDRLGVWRPTSAAFQDHPDGSPMSVDIASEMEAHNLTPQDCLHGHESTHALAAISVGIVRSIGLGVLKVPLDSNAAHGQVTGRKSRKNRKELARASDWIVFSEEQIQ